MRFEARSARTATTSPLRIGNCSGFYGDRLTAMREMLEGGPLDVLTGDYLAELTMLILGRDTMKDPSLGYARTFVRQAEDCLGLALERGVRIVANAGGLNPAGLAERLREVARGLGLDPAIAHVEGDDLRPLGLWEGALTANAYLGGLGIAAALRAGADVVVTGRVTDASLVVGPAVAHHGWTPSSTTSSPAPSSPATSSSAGPRRRAATSAASSSLPDRTGPSASRWPRSPPTARASSPSTTAPGARSPSTPSPPSSSTRSSPPATSAPTSPPTSTRSGCSQQGPDRVAITGVRGEAPPAQLKVCVNELGGWRNSVELVLTGLDVDAKAAWVRDQLTAALAATPPQETTWSELVLPAADAETEQGASTLLRCTVKDADPAPVGKPFTAAAVELALASYPGFTLTAPPSPPTPYGVYRARYVDRSQVEHTVVHADGTREVVADPPVSTADHEPDLGIRPSPYPATADVLTRRLPLGTFVHARSGDKGGDANLGLWVAHDGSEHREARVAVAEQADHPAADPRAGARGGRPGRRLSTCCPTWAASTW